MTTISLDERRAAVEATRALAEAMGQAMPSESRLETFPDILQGTDEWYDQRRGMLTASAIGQMITAKTLAPANNDTSRGLIALLAAERITGVTDPTYVSDDMLRGTEDEPYAVDAYSEHYAPVTAIGFMVRSWGACRLGYSPDGLVGSDGLIEVKSRRSKMQVLAVTSGEVPAANMAQLQAGLFVSGRAWIDYVSFSGGMHLWKVRVLPDPKWFAAIIGAVEAFESAASDMVARYTAAVEGLPLMKRPVTEMVI